MLKNIRYRRYFSKPAVFAGDKVEMKEIIENDKILPVPWVRLASRMAPSLIFEKQKNLGVESEQFLSSLFSLTPYQKIIRTHEVTCLRRGYFYFKEAQLTSGDLIGLVKKYRHVEAVSSLLVYPEIRPIKDLPIPSHQLQGDYFVRRWIAEDPFINAGVREYQPGDSLRSVNWKASARAQTMQVNKKDFTADYRLMIYVNFDQNEDIRLSISDEALVEKAISYAASIAYYTTSKGIPTGFGCNGYLYVPGEKIRGLKDSVRLEPRTGKSHLYSILKTMAKLKIDRSMPFHKFLKEDVNQNRRKTDYLFISAFSSANIEKNIRLLQRKGNTVDYLWLTNDAKSVHESKEATQEGGHSNGA
ncbi:DUF58 domain-containing protein [Salipaludibacillus sp. HK11]|uniref:DUF58 domain-containing protein n=1 Tax=Salipaludibacillus sp. HK11 TaxID=3394320 RepID=UPI0039FBEAD8